MWAGSVLAGSAAVFLCRAAGPCPWGKQMLPESICRIELQLRGQGRQKDSCCLCKPLRDDRRRGRGYRTDIVRCRLQRRRQPREACGGCKPVRRRRARQRGKPGVVAARRYKVRTKEPRGSEWGACGLFPHMHYSLRRHYRDPKARQSYMEPVLKAAPEVRPVDSGFFAGVLDYSKMNLVARMVMKAKMQAKGIPEGDFRNWNAITSWAKGLIVPFGS